MLTSRRDPATARIDGALEVLGLRRRVALVAPGFQAALVMAASSDLIATMPKPFALWAMAYLRLKLFILPLPMPLVKVSQTWHARHHADPAHAWLRGHVQALCRDAG
ncbi:MAG: hypothetical protein K2P84_01655 [Undibacterium sp.]|nr:hypothetical protein [Undibacterium sp.]